MSLKKKIIIVAVIIAVAGAALAVAFMGGKKDDKKTDAPVQTETVKKDEQAPEADLTQSEEQTAEGENKAEATEEKAETKDEKKEEKQTEKKEDKKVEVKVEAEDGKKDSKSEKAIEKAEESVVAPEHNINVMYLVSNSNANKDEVLKMAEELRKEYETKVYFTVMNIDEDEMGANFALPDETPKLVMFGENNLFEMKNNCSDKEEIKKAIDSAIEKG